MSALPRVRDRSALLRRWATALCFCVLPMGASVLFAVRLLPDEKARELLAYSTLIAGITASVFVLWLRRFEGQEPRVKVVEPKVRERPQVVRERGELVSQLQQQLIALRTQLDLAQSQAQTTLLQKQAEMEELAKSMHDQRQLIAKKQMRIAKLEAKVRDLNYEVKTLLQLDDLRTDEETPVLPRVLAASQEPPVVYEGPATNSDQASTQLHRLVAGTQRLTGMAHLAGQGPRYLEAAGATSALDLRRLFDQLQDDPNLILVYSKREGQLLFANSQVRSQLGWNPERFVKEFFLIVQHGVAEWHRAVTMLDHQAETRVKLALKHRDGHDVFAEGVLSRISQGPFAGLVLALVYRSRPNA